MSEFKESEELLKLMAALGSAQQRAALRRVAEVLIASEGNRRKGPSLNKLFLGPDKICSKNTYVRKPDGWSHLPEWQAALAQYVKEYTPHYLATLRGKALRILEEAAVEASEQQVKLLKSKDEGVKQRAINAIHDRVGVGQRDEQGGGGLTLVIENPQWQPG